MRSLLQAGAVVTALAVVGMLASSVLIGAEIGWVVELPPQPGEEVGLLDLREELPWMAVLTLGVLVGAFLTVRRPRHPIPWLIMAVGVGFVGFPAVVMAVAYATAGGSVPGWAPYVAWVGNWIWILGHVGGIYLLLLFPDGTALSSRWHRLAQVGAVYIALTFVLVAVWPELEAAPALDHPFGVQALADAGDAVLRVVFGYPLLQLLAVVCVVQRFARSTGVERAQMKWMAFGAASLAVTLVAVMLGAPRWLQSVPTGLLVAAVVVAVTRYRLFEIDRIISRTVTYSAVTVLLVGVYAAGVFGLGAGVRAVSGGAGGDLVVAASTLAVAALFQPLRNRVQRAVDRRFNRSRFDAVRTVEAFALRLRDEVDVEVLATDVRQVAMGTLGTRSVSLWFAEPAADTARQHAIP